MPDLRRSLPSSLALLVAGAAASLSAQDLDGDGWTAADGDCCDVASVACPFPELVNPGAVEVAGNGVDDDCDGLVDEVDGACSTGADFSVDAWQLAGALDLCTVADAAPPLADKRWGVFDARLVFADGSDAGFYSFDLQTAAMESFGANVSPLSGATMAVLSSGVARDKDDPGYAVPHYPGTSHGNFGSPPAAFLAAHGGELPSLSPCGACPNGSGAYDSVNLRLSIRVPTNAEGFRLRHRFFAADFHVYWCTTFDDFAVGLVQGGAVASGTDVLLDVLGNPLSQNSAWFESCAPKSCYLCGEGELALEGTGYDEVPAVDGEPCGGATVWNEAVVPVVPGEELVLELMVFDVTDGSGDSLILLDAFEWDLIDPCPSGAASEVVRLGDPPNPAALLPGQTSGPVFGATWDPRIDHAAFAPAAVLDVLAISTGTANLPLPWGTLLCDPSPPSFTVPGTPGLAFAIPIPDQCWLTGATLCTQGVSIDGLGGIALTNALDVTLGTF